MLLFLPRRLGDTRGISGSSLRCPRFFAALAAVRPGGGQSGGSAPMPAISPTPQVPLEARGGLRAICGSSRDSLRVVITPPVGKSQDDRADKPPARQALAEARRLASSEKEADDG